jgi:hypothetical protein
VLYLRLLRQEGSHITSLCLSFVIPRHTGSDSSLRTVPCIFHVDELGSDLEVSCGGSLAPVVLKALDPISLVHHAVVVELQGFDVGNRIPGF